MPGQSGHRGCQSSDTGSSRESSHYPAGGRRMSIAALQYRRRSERYKSIRTTTSAIPPSTASAGCRGRRVERGTAKSAAAILPLVSPWGCCSRLGGFPCLNGNSSVMHVLRKRLSAGEIFQMKLVGTLAKTYRPFSSAGLPSQDRSTKSRNEIWAKVGDA